MTIKHAVKKYSPEGNFCAVLAYDSALREGDVPDHFYEEWRRRQEADEGGLNIYRVIEDLRGEIVNNREFVRPERGGRNPRLVLEELVAKADRLDCDVGLRTHDEGDEAWHAKLIRRGKVDPQRVVVVDRFLVDPHGEIKYSWLDVDEISDRIGDLFGDQNDAVFFRTHERK